MTILCESLYKICETIINNFYIDTNIIYIVVGRHKEIGEEKQFLAIRYTQWSICNDFLFAL